jgi:hypothetical protein
MTADSAKNRLQALGNQLAPASSNSGIPAIVKVAPESDRPRVAGKVVIITGK